MSVSYLTVKCPCGETASTGTGKVCRNGITKPLPDDPSEAETQTIGMTWPREWPVVCTRSTTLLTGTQHWQWSRRSASRSGRPRRCQCEQGAGAQGRQCLQHHPGHPSDCERGARRLVCAPISFSSMISRAAWLQSTLHVQRGMHWWHCRMQSKGCCKSSSEQFGTSSFLFTSCVTNRGPDVRMTL